jgi:hypothetical protein
VKKRVCFVGDKIKQDRGLFLVLALTIFAFWVAVKTST